MSIATAPTALRALTPTRGSERTQRVGDQPAPLPDTVTDEQGRVYRLQHDPATGIPQYRYASQQRDQTGSSLTLEILITLATDGSFTRRTTQQLDLASGDAQRDVLLTSYDALGVQVGSVQDTLTREGSATTQEHTVGTFTGGQLVRRETDVVQRSVTSDTTTGERNTVEARVHGTWFDAGRPITKSTIPTVDRTTTQHLVTPGQGINKDTPRALAFTSHGAGPVSSIDWDDAGSLTVRFDGHGKQYIERELRVPLDQSTGAPQMDAAEVVRTDDHQNLVNKGLTQARIWGGLTSNLAWLLGLTFVRGRAGMGLLALSTAAAGAQLTGEVHAVATRRNDGDWGRVAMSAYDLVLTGMVAAFMTGRSGARLSSMPTAVRAGLGVLGTAGVATNLHELSDLGPRQA